MYFNNKNYIHYDYHTINEFRELVNSALDNLNKVSEINYYNWCEMCVKNHNNFKWWQIKRIPITIDEFKKKNTFEYYIKNCSTSRNYEILNELKNSIQSEINAYSFTLNTYRYVKDIASFRSYSEPHTINWIDKP